MPTDGIQQVRPDSRDAVEPLQAPERAVLAAPIHDALREGGSHAWQPRDLRHVGAVEIDALTGGKRPGELSGATSGFAQVGTGRPRRGLELDVAGSRLGRRREKEADAGTGQREAGKEQRGATIVHSNVRGTWCVVRGIPRRISDQAPQSTHGAAQ